MAYQSKSFTFWVSYYDVAQELNAKEQGEFYRAIMDYIFVGDDREESLSKTVRIAFKSVKANLKRSLSNRRESDGNRAAIGTESDGNRDEEPQSENALKLKLKLNSKSKPSDGGGGCGKPAASARAERLATPPCPNPQCNGHLYRNTQTGVMVCDTCSEVAS